MWCFPPFVISALVWAFYAILRWYRKAREIHHQREERLRAKWIASGRDAARFWTLHGAAIRLVKDTGRLVRRILLPPR